MGSDDNWFNLLVRAVQENHIGVGVDHVRASRNPASPVRSMFTINKSKIRRQTLEYAFRDASHWRHAWDAGLLQLNVTEHPEYTCNPGEYWLDFVKEHCMHLLTGAKPKSVEAFEGLSTTERSAERELRNLLEDQFEGVNESGQRLAEDFVVSYLGVCALTILASVRDQKMSLDRILTRKFGQSQADALLKAGGELLAHPSNDFLAGTIAANADMKAHDAGEDVQGLKVYLQDSTGVLAAFGQQPPAFWADLRAKLDAARAGG